MQLSEITPGMELTWRHESRGGYGYITKVHVTVVSVGKKMVRVEAPLTRGGAKLVNVKPEMLQARAS